MSEVILQHYVPQFVLREFVGPDGMLVVMERGSQRTWRSRPEKVACERFYNATRAPDGGLDTQTVEKQLGDIETAAAPLIEVLRNGGELTPSDRMVVATFVAVQDFRSVRKRQQYADALLAFEHNKLGDKAPLSAEQMLDLMRDASRNKSQLSPQQGFADPRLRLDDDGTVTASREDTVKALDAAFHFAPNIADMQWMLFTADPGHPFLLCDSPVVLWEDPRTLPEHTGPGYWRPETRVSLPLSPTCLLVAHHAPRQHLASRMTRRLIPKRQATGKEVRFFNALQMQAAYRQIYAIQASDCVSACNVDPLRRGIGVQS
jgi:hypothetical protein